MFFLGQFCYVAQENLARFGYKLNMEVNLKKDLPIFFATILKTTYRN